MKKLITIIGISILLYSCSNGGDKKAQLEKLKKQEAELSEKIKALEKELALENKSGDSAKQKTVAITELALKPFKHYIDIQGRVDATENINISPKMQGIVTKINVKEGDVVKTGQVLAEMDDQLIKQSIEEVKNSLSLANTVYEKQKNLWEQKIGSEVQYLTAKNQKEGLDKRKATLEEQLDMTKIKSPINGTVDLVSLRIGQGAMPGLPSIRVVNLSKLKAKADVAEAYSSKIKKGNDVVLVFPDLNKEIRSSISFVGTVIDQLNRTFTIEVPLDSGIPDYHPNMITVLRVIDYQSETSMVVPINVIQNSEEGKYLFIAAETNGKIIAKKQMVTIGLTYNGETEIIGGLNKGDKIITSGYQDLNEGELLKF
ncbi:MAG: efflux RND transporter periplasmic adaptor subunit [Bacteroidota bacterium]